MAEVQNTLDSPQPDGVAVIGMAGRFPGAPSVERFWHNLRNGKETIESLGQTQEPQDSSPDRPHRVQRASSIEGIEDFDAAFFGLSPAEAAATDPQHRVFLECAWHALEDAGCPVSDFPGRIGVFAGASISTYLTRNLYPSLENHEEGIDLPSLIANDKDYLATRTSYLLGLRGPSVAVQTACSSSLVAVHYACQSLLLGESDLALAGGVTIRVPQKRGYLYQPDGYLSPDGRCRAFDEKAGGAVFGNGAGIVVLKRLAEALADGDRIACVILGSAVNNDGATKMSFTAPSIDGQVAVISEALAAAGVGPESISYVEAHGTGTPLGDPIEVSALTRAFGKSSGSPQHCALGSVKTNVGHLESAAGVTGLIKTALALRHGEIPPSLNFRSPNPRIDFQSSPFFVNAKRTPWKGGQTPRRAGVSSFGIGGTNAHVVLEEAPKPDRRQGAPRDQGQKQPAALLLPLSARCPEALRQL
ncbi:MAG TPA: polyketide synthase, partial [Acidobacteriota bacterium]|nr:polyketide synthase [Acidobacteriota bacterium]